MIVLARYAAIVVIRFTVAQGRLRLWLLVFVDRVSRGPRKKGVPAPRTGRALLTHVVLGFDRCLDATGRRCR